ncbi:MAG TPA: DUF2163 domain-containing protein [Terriglobia bacterium]|nr:DUF2163 domain-containing protein [Terriglobia bacterium]
MRQTYSGTGANTTSTVAAALLQGNEFLMADLILIGSPEDPLAIWLTNWEAPLLWSLWGTFHPAVISRGQVATKTGLEVVTLDLTWSPSNITVTNNVSTTTPYQLARIGYYDNWPVRLWTCYMPTPGDANTYGACELFGGRISECTVERGAIHFTVNSFLDVVNQYVPANTIELLNTVASWRGASPPAGLSVVPYFTAHAGSSDIQVYGDCTSPTPGQIFNQNALRGGYIVFRGGSLNGVWSSILSNQHPIVGGVEVNDFVLYQPLPWPPSAGDVFYATSTSPINQADGDYYGFPYVPNPETGI